MIYLWIEIGSLLHQRADSKPKTVAQTELVSNDGRIGDARVRIMPFVWRKTAD